MLKIPKQDYTTEFRTLAVKRVKDGQNIRDVARELGISHETLRNGVKAHDAGTLNGPGTKVITPEQMKLSRSLASAERPCIAVSTTPSLLTSRPCHQPRLLARRNGVDLAA